MKVRICQRPMGSLSIKRVDQSWLHKLFSHLTIFSLWPFSVLSQVTPISRSKKSKISGSPTNHVVSCTAPCTTLNCVGTRLREPPFPR